MMFPRGGERPFTEQTFVTRLSPRISTAQVGVVLGLPPPTQRIARSTTPLSRTLSFLAQPTALLCSVGLL
jgi:hypothetical protein